MNVFACWKCGKARDFGGGVRLLGGEGGGGGEEVSGMEEQV